MILSVAATPAFCHRKTEQRKKSWMNRRANFPLKRTGQLIERREAFFDVGLKRHAIDGPIKEPGLSHAARAQAGDEGRCFPMFMGHARAQAFAAWATSMAPRHVGRGLGFVNEDQAAGVEIELTFEPFLAALQISGRSCSLACAVFFYA